MTETNAERLERAGSLLKAICEMGDGIGEHGKDIAVLEWLIEQAGRPQELEEALNIENGLHNKAYDDAVRLDNENKRLRVALSRIAHGDTHTAYPHDIAKWALEGVSNDQTIQT